MGLNAGETASELPGRGELIHAVVDWCECLQGHLPLVTALRRLAEGLGARSVALARLTRGPHATARAVTWNAEALRPGQRVARSYAASVLGRYVERPRVGSVWLSSLAEDGDPALAVFQARAGLREAVVIPLSSDGRVVDFLELHFDRALGQDGGARLQTVAATLSRTWANRSPGLFSDSVLASQAGARLGFAEPLLSAANPARLSRAEFRVCLCLSRGLNAAAVAGELAISPSTLKTHLRSIFAKTETASLAELMFRLLAPRPEATGAVLLSRPA